MKTFILAATFAAVSLPLAAPVQAYSAKLALTNPARIAAAQAQFDRRGRGGGGTDSARDKKERR